MPPDSREGWKRTGEEPGRHFDPEKAALFIVAAMDGPGFHHFLDRTPDLPGGREAFLHFLQVLCTGLRGGTSR